MPRTPKRVYDWQAIEYWFNCLVDPWESFFSTRALKLGREFYSAGLARTVELTGKEAIVHVKLHEQDAYAVIGWEQERKQPIYRSSIAETLMAAALAVAAFYEVEELVAQETAATIDFSRDQSQVAIAEQEEPEPEIKPQEPLAEKEESPTRSQQRQLSVHYHLELNQLVGEVFWLTPDNERQPFTQKPTVGFDNAHERAQRIQLAQLKRALPFATATRGQKILLSQGEHIRSFVNSELPRWQRAFNVELTPDVQALTKPTQNVQLQMAAAAKSPKTASITWALHIDGTRGELDADTVRLLLRNSGRAVALPGIGFAQLNADKAEILDDWQHRLRHRAMDPLPRYLLFSLFANAAISQWHLDQALVAWRNSFALGAEAMIREKFLSLQKDEASLPDWLYPFQQQGVRWLTCICELGGHPLLADEMGLGKTLQALTLVLQTRPSKKPTLIVCPASVISVWIHELVAKFPGTIYQVLSTGNDFHSVQEPPKIWLASYTQLRRHRSLLSQTPFGYAILDEAHTIKNPTAKTSQACFAIDAEQRIALTGTPIENQHLDIWSICHFLMPGLLGTRRRFLELLKKETSTFTAKLNQQLVPFVLRRTKKSVLQDLPDKVENTLYCPLTEMQQGLYRKLTQEGVAKLAKDYEVGSSRMHIFALLTRLRQVCCDPGLLASHRTLSTMHSGKLRLLLQKLSDVVMNNRKVVIFSQFVSLLDRAEQAIREEYSQLHIEKLTGRTQNRAVRVERFQRSPGAAVFLISLRAGGVGITLHAADYVFLLDPWWNPALEQQAIDRVHRIGQQRVVFIYRLLTQDTIEDRIQELKRYKTGLLSSVLTEKKALEQLSTLYSDLRTLIALPTKT